MFSSHEHDSIIKTTFFRKKSRKRFFQGKTNKGVQLRAAYCASHKDSSKPQRKLSHEAKRRKKRLEQERHKMLTKKLFSRFTETFSREMVPVTVEDEDPGPQGISVYM